jgi:hypothetical protein
MIVIVIHTMLSSDKRGKPMILQKLQEALAEVAAQRKELDGVERQLQAMIAQLSGTHASQSVTVQLPSVVAPLRIAGRDRIDDIVDILSAESKPLHITVIASRLSEKFGKKIDRTMLEPGLNRHVQKTQKARIAKFGKSTFGLPAWKQPTDLELLSSQAKVS